jgi:hypothetical protein
MAAFEQVSGLAGEIRSLSESDSLDLGGYTEQRARDLMINSFSSPLPNPTQMIRIQFIVGGGKLVRSKYDDQLSRWCTTTLREIGFSEDRSAAETYDSQGFFKQQHDTGQNLKYLVVYPFVACAPKEGGGDLKAEPVEELLDTTSPDYLVSACELSTFKDIVASKSPSWRQRKRVLKSIQESSDRFELVEQKLCTGAQLTEREQAIYESNSGVDSEKMKWLQSAIKSLVDAGNLTQSEKEELKNSLETNLNTIKDEIELAKKEEKPKKVEKLEEKKSSIKARIATVSDIKPKQLRLRHADEILRLRLKLLPLLAVEDKGRSMSLTLADLKTLEQKSDIEEKINGLETASRGWFEDEEDFQSKVEIEIKEAKTKYDSKTKTAPKNKNKPVVKAPTSSSGWATAPTKTSRNSSYQAVKKVNGFSSAFGNDSDSD